MFKVFLFLLFLFLFPLLYQFHMLFKVILPFFRSFLARLSLQARSQILSSPC